MTLIEPIPQLRDMNRSDVFDIPRADARYHITSSAGENQNPEVVLRAQQVHGRSYVKSKYFTERGLLEDGRLHDELDGTRSDPYGKVIANYLLATRYGEDVELASATVRILDIGHNGTIEDLPTYKYFSDIFTDDVKQELQRILDVYGKGSIREIAALGTTDKGEHPGSFELIRAMMQNSILKEDAGNPELYIASLTPRSLDPVLDYIDKKSAKLLAEPVQIFSDDPRSLSIYVTPVLIDLSSVLYNVSRSIADTQDSEERAALEAKLAFLTDGLPTDIVQRFTGGGLSGQYTIAPY